MHLVDSSSPTIFVFIFLSGNIVCVWKKGSNHSTTVISENQLLGVVLLSCEGKVTLLFPGLSVVEEMGLSHVYLPLLFSGRPLLCQRRKRKKHTVIVV